MWVRIALFMSVFAVIVYSGQPEHSPLVPSAADTAPAAPASLGKETSWLISCEPGRMEAVATRLQQSGATVESRLEPVDVVVAATRELKFAERVRSMPGVLRVAPNLRRTREAEGALSTGEAVDLAYTPLEVQNPPNSSNPNERFDLQWGLDAIDAPEAWQEGARGAGVLVAVVDGGIDPLHPDMAGQVRTDLAASFVPGESWDYNVGPPGPSPLDHGLFVSGIIAAADNNVGIIGVAPEAKIVPVHVISRTTLFGFDSWVLAGIVHAAQVGADVINLSIGGFFHQSGYHDPFENRWISASEVAAVRATYNQVMQYVHSQGCVVVAAIGNSALDMDGSGDLFILPAEAPRVIGVSATGPLGWGLDPNAYMDHPTFYTNYGKSIVTFSAPGGNRDQSEFAKPPEEWTWIQVGPVLAPSFQFDLCYSTATGGWRFGGGTSFAAPHVSGVAALVIEKHGLWKSPQQVLQKLKQSADSIGSSGKDKFHGFGRVNAYQAVK